MGVKDLTKLSGKTQEITDGSDYSAPLSGKTQKITDEKDIFSVAIRGNAGKSGWE